ncbi:MAG: YHS domain-containing (seleno)protein [Luteolibacter sp.]
MKTQSTIRRIVQFTLLIVLGLGLADRLHAQARNLEKSGRALQGYDPVAFFTDKKPVKGDPTISSKVNGATYYFSTAENKATFDKDPAKYEPQFGGYCAYGVSKGSLVKIEVDAFQIVNGRLLLQYNKGIRDKFNKDTAGNLKTADAKWPTVSKEQPAKSFFE